MSVEAGNNFLPQKDNPSNAFDVINHRYPGLGYTLAEISLFSLVDLKPVAGDYFTAAVAYLANRGQDAYLQEVGTTVWWMVNQKRAATALTNDMFSAALQLGVPPRIARDNFTNNHEPHICYVLNKSGPIESEMAIVLMPMDYIYLAKNKPIEALGTMAWIGSQVRDMANGRFVIDPEHVETRAEATEAHFLKEAIRRHPETVLSADSQIVLRRYPQGIASLSPSLRYKGDTGEKSSSAPFN